MVGFLSSLFRSKKADAIAAKPEPKVKPEPKAKPEAKAKREPKAKPAQPARVDNSNAYFLDTDNARTMGNADYMRTASTTRRTFPKTLNGQSAAFEQTLSSLEIKPRSDGSFAQASTFGNGSSAKNAANAQPPKPETERRRPDRSMDVFRNMAKEIRK